jgi:hypothetical protein
VPGSQTSPIKSCHGAAFRFLCLGLAGWALVRLWDLWGLSPSLARSGTVLLLAALHIGARDPANARPPQPALPVIQSSGLPCPLRL